MTILLLPERKHLAASPIDTWLARGDRLPDQPPGDEALLRGVFRFDGPLAAAALTRHFDVGDAGTAQWLRADPAWVRADMMTARMFAHGELGLSAGEIAALFPDLAVLFAEHDLVFDAPTPTRWYLRCPDDLALPDFVDPDDAIGDDLKLHLPQGPAGKRWRVLTNELQILLHNHPVNRRRVGRGAAVVNSLWLWGGGRLPASVHADVAAAYSDDPPMLALARLAGIPCPPIETFDSAGFATPSAGRDSVLDLRDAGIAGSAAAGWLATPGRLPAHPRDVRLRLRCGLRSHYCHRHRWRYWR